MIHWKNNYFLLCNTKDLIVSNQFSLLPLQTGSCRSLDLPVTSLAHKYSSSLIIFVLKSFTSSAETSRRIFNQTTVSSLSSAFYMDIVGSRTSTTPSTPTESRLSHSPLSCQPLDGTTALLPHLLSSYL